MDQTDKDIMHDITSTFMQYNITIQGKNVKSWDDSLWMKDMQEENIMSIYRKVKYTILRMNKICMITQYQV